MSSSSRRIVALDLDDTMNLLHRVLHASACARGITIPVSRWDRYDIYELFGMSVPEFQDMIVKDRILEHAPPDPYAAAAVRLLQQHDFDVEVWTARGFHPAADQITRAELAAIGIFGVEVHILPYGLSKGVHAAQPRYRGRLAGFADDHARHVRALAPMVTDGAAALISRPWNIAENYQGPRVQSVWDAASTIIAANEETTRAAA